jgi:hypothetical protein
MLIVRTSLPALLRVLLTVRVFLSFFATQQAKLVQPNSTPKSLLKNPQMERFVTGHDFSRADKANQINGALAPVGPLYDRFRPFSTSS